MKIGDRIREVRTSKSLTQKEVAITLQMDQSQYSKIEKGKTDPSFSTIERIADALSVQVADLVSEDNPFEEVNSKGKAAVEKVRLIEGLDEEEKSAIYSIIDGLVSKKKMKDSLSSLISG